MITYEEMIKKVRLGKVRGKVDRQHGFVAIYNENRRYHSYDDEPCIMWEDGSKNYRNDGPLHRLYGPATINHNADRVICRWYLNNVEYKPEDHPYNIFRKEYNLPEEYENWSTEMKILFELIYR